MEHISTAVLSKPYNKADYTFKRQWWTARIKKEWVAFGVSFAIAVVALMLGDTLTFPSFFYFLETNIVKALGTIIIIVATQSLIRAYRTSFEEQEAAFSRKAEDYIREVINPAFASIPDMAEFTDLNHLINSFVYDGQYSIWSRYDSNGRGMVYNMTLDGNILTVTRTLQPTPEVSLSLNK